MRTTTYRLTDNFFGKDSPAVTVHANDDDIPGLILKAMHQSGEQPDDVQSAIDALAVDIARGGSLEQRTRDTATALGLTIERV